jgi:hypothetical protein
MANKTLRTAASFGGLSAGDRFRITDPETGETFASTVEGASYYAEDPDGSLLWRVVTDDGTPWDLFPADLKDPSFARLPKEVTQ